MPREPKIRWTAAQRKRLNSAARRYNNALRKAAKNIPDAALFLPDEVKYSELKAEITTRRALRNVVNRLNRATRPGAFDLVRQDDGSIVTRYERNEFNILKSVRERRKSQEAKRKNITQPPKGSVGNLEQARLSPDTRKVGELSARSLRRFIETQSREMNLSNEATMRRYWTNYMKAIYGVFGGFADYDDKVSFIQERVLELAEKDWVALEKALDESPDIKFIYDPIEREAKMQRLYEYWAGV